MGAEDGHLLPGLPGQDLGHIDSTNLISLDSASPQNKKGLQRCSPCQKAASSAGQMLRLGFVFIFYEAMKARMAAPAHGRVWALAQHNLLLATLLKHLCSSPHENTSFSLTGLPSLFTSCMCSIFVDWLAWPGEPIMALASESDCVLPGRHCVGFLPKELTVSSEFP